MIKLPESAERDEQEIGIRVAAGGALMNLKGFGAPQVASNYARALELCERTADSPRLFPILRGIAISSYSRGEFARAAEIGERCLRIAELAEGNDMRIEAHRLQAATRLWLGEFERGRAHARTAVDLYDPLAHANHVVLYAHNPGPTSIAYLGWLEWFVGNPVTANRLSQEAVALARTIGHVPTLAFAGLVSQGRGDPSGALALARELRVLCVEHIIPFWLAFATAQEGSALSKLGRTDSGLELIREGIDNWRATSAELAATYLSGSLAALMMESGDLPGALVVTTDAMAMSHRNGEKFWLAELARGRANILIRLGREHYPEAELALMRFLAVAREQQSRTFEFRTLTTLHELLAGLGRQQEIRAELESCYADFTEGFDLPDLALARKRLGENPGVGINAV